MRPLWASIAGFLRQLVRGRRHQPPHEELSDEVAFEHEHRRGMRGF